MTPSLCTFSQSNVIVAFQQIGTVPVVDFFQCWTSKNAAAFPVQKNIVELNTIIIEIVVVVPAEIIAL